MSVLSVSRVGPQCDLCLPCVCPLSVPLVYRAGCFQGGRRSGGQERARHRVLLGLNGWYTGPEELRLFQVSRDRHRLTSHAAFPTRSSDSSSSLPGLSICVRRRCFCPGKGGCEGGDRGGESVTFVRPCFFCVCVGDNSNNNNNRMSLANGDVRSTKCVRVAEFGRDVFL